MNQYPSAALVPGIAGNRGYDGQIAHEKDGAVLHSADGNFGPGNTPADIMWARGVSWQFTVYKSGRVEQHFDPRDTCWHAGNREANKTKVGIEHEGRPGEPLTPAQLAASVDLVRWLGELLAFPVDRSALYEHNQFFPTACPSGRIPWGEYTPAEVPEDDMAYVTEEAFAQFKNDLTTLYQEPTQKFLSDLYAEVLDLRSDLNEYIEFGTTPDRAKITALEEKVADINARLRAVGGNQ